MNTDHMPVRYCALSLGILFLFIGLAGFVPGFTPTHTYIPHDAVHGAYGAGYGNLFGIFPTNFLHNLVHLFVGLLGIAAFTSVGGSRVFNQGFAISYILIAFLGLLPFSNTMFGMMPIFGNNVWLNALTGLIAGYYGFLQPTEPTNISLPSNP